MVANMSDDGQRLLLEGLLPAYLPLGLYVNKLVESAKNRVLR